ncbi:glycoside hydrolase family 57 protein [Actinosynnema sp. NPDC047251]|uniref:Glycoside hydrolase family 57 n=1 Tax=Saccharothrix espanaensis (strain ATCC 51144 / DSM 44229 / JCM 9112 / NBRC 15066 / NRRL 15764) TaxID=1179773 RepID=K0KAD9_SACES|nr:glycoside hydrolase family 57 protein [Saccharothrix espanaensis]CCH34492.1 Glycoside hydrolase family 57 [Saccharothrix espanaensis DSM 44229]
MTEGTFCLVLHSHLPWLAHHGAWPVGEEWLYQAWAHSYLPVVDLLERFAGEGREDVLTLGVTPVLAAQLDDPYCLRGVHDWLGDWQLRAHSAAPRLPELSAREHRASRWALEKFETRWRHGFSPILKSLVDSRTVELLGGPAAHPFQPLLDPGLRAFSLRTGLADTRLRLGSAPEGIWAPECAYAPGMEEGYAAAGVRRFLVDGPSLHGDTAAARPVGSSDVLCFGRDLEVSYRVWSPKVGYPGDPAYRDFHTYDHPSGLKPSRVTGVRVEPGDKAPYSPQDAAVVVRRDAADFVDVVVRRLRSLRERHGKPSLVVAAYDTELYGHWWHEGPAWLEAVLRALPEAGVRVTTLRGAVEAGHVGAPVEIPPSSWGAGKDWHVWNGPQVADVVDLNAGVQRELLALDLAGRTRDPVADQAVREALLALSSDWAFMVTKDSAADYARYRAKVHADRFAELAALLRPGGGRGRGRARAAELRALDGPFGHLDARGLG